MTENWKGEYENYVASLDDSALVGEIVTVIKQSAKHDGERNPDAAILLQMCHRACEARGKRNLFIDGHNQAVREMWYPDGDALEREMV